MVDVLLYNFLQIRCEFHCEFNWKKGRLLPIWVKQYSSHIRFQVHDVETMIQIWICTYILRDSENKIEAESLVTWWTLHLSSLVFHQKTPEYIKLLLSFINVALIYCTCNLLVLIFMSMRQQKLFSREVICSSTTPSTHGAIFAFRTSYVHIPYNH
jgi:hypothetical protein